MRLGDRQRCVRAGRGKMPTSMRHPLTIFALCFLGFVAFLFTRTTDLYRQVSDPLSFWTERVERGEAMVRFYRNDIRACDEKNRQLSAATSRDTWLKQKRLEGLSSSEAEADYLIAINASRTACETMRGILALEMKDLENARSKLMGVKR